MNSRAPRTYVYVDGFNLYYRALKGRGENYRWLNPHRLAEKVLSHRYRVARVKYFTARVKKQDVSSTAARDQNVYLNALETLPTISIFYGYFLSTIISRPLEKSPTKRVRVRSSEEKGSDVKLASHLVNDAWRGLYDVAAVITNDTDLVEPIKIVSTELGKHVVVMSPVKKCASALREAASRVYQIRAKHITQSQLPDSIQLGRDKSPIVKPVGW